MVIVLQEETDKFERAVEACARARLGGNQLEQFLQRFYADLDPKLVPTTAMDRLLILYGTKEHADICCGLIADLVAKHAELFSKGEYRILKAIAGDCP